VALNRYRSPEEIRAGAEAVNVVAAKPTQSSVATALEAKAFVPE